MYSLFTVIPELHHGKQIPPVFDVIRSMYVSNIDNIVNYYQNSTFTAKSNHILAKILNDASIPLDYDLEKYISIAYNRSPYIAKLHKLTSDITKGEIVMNNFYSNSKEILLYVESYIDFDTINDWRKLRPVNVLKHPYNDLDLSIPDGNNTVTYDELSVITIDIPLLLMMYRSFLLERSISGEDVTVSIPQFIGRYVLPNMLYSQTDIAIVNRCMAFFYGKPLTHINRKHPLAISDYSYKLDKVLKKIIKQLKNKNIYYSAALKNIPAITSIDAYSSLTMPDIAPTRQVWWALFISRIDVMLFLLELCGAKGRRRNSDLLSNLSVDIKRLINENVYGAMLDEELDYQTNMTIDDILQLVSSR